MATKEKERIRFRYGICLNDQCPKCKSKDVQEIPARKELICTECQKPLRECPPPPPPTKWWKKIGIPAAVVLLGGGIAYYCTTLSGEEKKSEPVVTEEPAKIVEDADTVKPLVEESQVEEKKVEETENKGEKDKEKEGKSNPGPVEKNPSWGKYDGARNASGLPHGNGVLRITRTTTINGETAHPGERIEGVFRNGYVNMGTWYKSDGNAVVVKDFKVI